MLATISKFERRLVRQSPQRWRDPLWWHKRKTRHRQPAPRAAVTVVQHAKNDIITGGASLTVNVTNCTAGNLLVVAAGCTDVASTISSVTDNASGGTNTYVQATSALGTAAAIPGMCDVWYALSLARGGGNVITVNFSTTTNYRAIWVWEVSGFTTAAFDLAAHVSTGTGSGTDINGASVTTTSSTGFVVGVGFVSSTITANPKAANEFTSGGDIQSQGPAACSLISSTAAAHQPVWTDSVSADSFCSSTAAFKETATALPPPSFWLPPYPSVQTRL